MSFIPHGFILKYSVLVNQLVRILISVVVSNVIVATVFTVKETVKENVLLLRIIHFRCELELSNVVNTWNKRTTQERIGII